jgi:putative hydrolases of HD superfamily
MLEDRLERQLAFIVEIDKLKRVLRQTLLADESRQENSAEHSWHLALMAGLLAEYAPAGTDVARVVRMVLVHDLVEIDAGDAFCYDPVAVMGKVEREEACADRLFGMLPPEQGAELRELWDDFEAGTTPEARFANSLDRLQPLLQNLNTRGGTWRMHGVRREQVVKRMEPIRDAMPQLWPLVESALERATAEGWVVNEDSKF